MESQSPMQVAGNAEQAPRADQGILECWNETRTDYPREQSVVEVFEEQVRQTPEAIALVFGERKLSYKELNCRANWVAKRLQDLGVQHEELVGCCLDRSVELIVAILGILKSGGCYVPLDPAYPRDQLLYMFGDTRTRVVLTEKHIAENVLSESQVIKIALDESSSLAIEESQENPSRIAGPQSLAYVMYTSGSTGRPKGVMIEHRSIVRLVKDTNYCDFGPEQVFLQLAPISFDASTLEIWGALLNGGRLVMMPAQTPSLEEIGRVIREQGVTIVWLTAGLFHLMVEQRVEDLRPLRQLLAGGDVLSPKHVARVLEKLPHVRLINGYGPTEGTTFTCCHTFDPQAGVTDPVPIGRAISNTWVYIVDSNLQQVPVGEPGELLIGGDGLARGYWNDPKQTANKFIDVAIRPAASPERLYRTGDQARFLPDGTIEFLGRTDEQIKLRGYRIELGEIEGALRRHPGVSLACVVAEREGPNAKRLLAYCVPSETTGVDAGEVREYLQKTLPAFMVPASIILVDAMPLTVNGKIDRAALPAPEKAEARTKSLPTGSVAEEAVWGVWRRVLRLPKIRTEDNFFDLGGDSLQLLEAHAELEKLLNIKIPIVELFQYTTADALVKWIEGNSGERNLFDDVQDKARKQKEMFARQRQLRASGTS